jgi:hypothetical protein
MQSIWLISPLAGARPAFPECISRVIFGVPLLFGALGLQLLIFLFVARGLGPADYGKLSVWARLAESGSVELYSNLMSFKLMF